MVLHKDGARLYEGITNLVSEHLKHEAVSRIQPAFPSSATGAATSDSANAQAGPSNHPDSMQQQASAQEGEKFLAALKSVWDDHTACMSKLKDLLKYMVCCNQNEPSCIIKSCSHRTRSMSQTLSPNYYPPMTSVSPCSSSMSFEAPKCPSTISFSLSCSLKSDSIVKVRSSTSQLSGLA